MVRLFHREMLARQLKAPLQRLEHCHTGVNGSR